MATNIVSFALAIVLLELFVEPRRGGVRRALAGVARSPLIWPFAVACVYLKIKPRLPVERFATLLAAAAGPCALFAIGLFVSQLSIRAGVRASWQTTVLKLVLHPIPPWYAQPCPSARRHSCLPSATSCWNPKPPPGR